MFLISITPLKLFSVWLQFADCLLLNFHISLYVIMVSWFTWPLIFYRNMYIQWCTIYHRPEMGRRLWFILYMYWWNKWSVHMYRKVRTCSKPLNHVRYRKIVRNTNVLNAIILIATNNLHVSCSPQFYYIDTK